MLHEQVVFTSAKLLSPSRVEDSKGQQVLNGGSEHTVPRSRVWRIVLCGRFMGGSLVRRITLSKPLRIAKGV